MVKLVDFRYEMSNCLFEATLQALELACNCTPKYFVDIVETLDACEGKKKKCMNNFLTQIGDKRSILDNGEIKVNIRKSPAMVVAQR